jgi:hypothetical protein
MCGAQRRPASRHSSDFERTILRSYKETPQKLPVTANPSVPSSSLATSKGRLDPSALISAPAQVCAVGIAFRAFGSELVIQIQLCHEMSILPMFLEKGVDTDCAALLDAELSS